MTKIFCNKCGRELSSGNYRTVRMYISPMSCHGERKGRTKKMDNLKIREVGGEYALDIPFADGSVNTIYFNSKRNAETVKRIIKVDGSKSNNATVCEMEEVKHGKWEKADTIMGTYNRCSVCHFDEFNIDFPYCPNCGAKMDLEEID